MNNLFFKTRRSSLSRDEIIELSAEDNVATNNELSFSAYLRNRLPILDHLKQFLIFFYALVFIFILILISGISVYINHSTRDSYQKILDENKAFYMNEINSLKDDLKQMNLTIDYLNDKLSDYYKTVDSNRFEINKSFNESLNLLDDKIMKSKIKTDELDLSINEFKIKYDSETQEMEKIFYETIDSIHINFNSSLKNHSHNTNTEIETIYTKLHDLNKIKKQNEDYNRIGDIKYSMIQEDHNGWLLCDGRTLSRGNYSALFGIIGTLYGQGDYFTTFNILDARGRTPVGAGKGVGMKQRLLGELGGKENVQLHLNNIPNHYHSISHQTVYVSPSSTFRKSYPINQVSSSSTNGQIALATNTPELFEIMQPYVVLNTFIYAGFPVDLSLH